MVTVGRAIAGPMLEPISKAHSDRMSKMNRIGTTERGPSCTSCQSCLFLSLERRCAGFLRCLLVSAMLVCCRVGRQFVVVALLNLADRCRQIDVLRARVERCELVLAQKPERRARRRHRAAVSARYRELNSQGIATE